MRANGLVVGMIRDKRRLFMKLQYSEQGSAFSNDRFIIQRDPSSSQWMLTRSKRSRLLPPWKRKSRETQPPLCNQVPIDFLEEESRHSTSRMWAS